MKAIDPTGADRWVAGLARVSDEELSGAASGPAGRQLLATLLAEPVQPERERRDGEGGGRRGRLSRRRVRLAVAAAAAGVLAAGVILAPSLLGDGAATSYANSAIDIRREGRYFVARIKDPLADHALYAQGFRALGKNVDIELVPVSPRLVGDLVEAGGNGGGLVDASSDLVSPGPDPVDCSLRPAACTLVIRISVDTRGASVYKIGRAARPGETFQDPVIGQNPGTGRDSGSGSDGGSGRGTSSISAGG